MQAVETSGVNTRINSGKDEGGLEYMSDFCSSVDSVHVKRCTEPRRDYDVKSTS